MKSIFTPFQKTVFEALCNDKFITLNFRFTGGTALSEFYLKHRYSEDLDFFSDEEISIEEVKLKISPIFKKIGINTIEYRETLSSKIFFLKRGQKETVKTDFNFWPFKRLEKGMVYKGMEIESLFDIALSKLETILTRGKARDFVDFYFIQKKNHYELEMLLEKLKDYPRMINKFSKQDIIKYFLSLAQAQKEKIVS